MPERTDHNEAMRLADEWEPRSYEVASMIRQQAERIAELEGELRQMTNNAGDLAVHSQKVEAARDQLRAEVERLRADAERLDWLQQAMSEGDEKVPGLCTDTGEFYFNYTHNGQIYCDGCSFDLRRTIDCARTTHKETE